MTLDEQIRKAVADAGNYRNALNLTMADLEVANALLKTEQERNAMLLDALEAIRAVAWRYGAVTHPRMKEIDTIARKVEWLSGQIPSHTEAE